MKTTFVGLLLALVATASTAHAQTKWPERPVRMIVSLAPGGSVDIVGRLIAARFSEQFGQQFVVDNRTGAGGTIGNAIAARATPDGYTLLVISSGFCASAALYKLPYDPIRDFAQIGMMAAGPLYLAVHPSVKAANLKEFIDLVRAKPGALSYGSGGTGSSTHLAVELFRQMTGTDMIHVPYKGIGAAIADLLSGQIQLYLAPGPAVFPHLKTGKLRAIGVSSEKRAQATPDLPAVSELVPGYSATFIYGLAAPAGTPAAIVSRLNESLARILKEPDIQERLRTMGLEASYSSPRDFAQFIGRDIAMWSKVVKAGNIKVD